MLSLAEQVIELEEEVDALRDQLMLRDNENQSLQTSLDLVTEENSRLASELGQRQAAVEESRAQAEYLKVAASAAETQRNQLGGVIEDLRAQVAQLMTALTAAQVERKALSAIAKAAEAKRISESTSLRSQFEAAAARAEAAEQLLADLQGRMLTTEEYYAVERLIAGTSTDRDAAKQQVQLLEQSLKDKESQLRALEHSRTELIDGTSSLLKTFGARDSALSNAEGIIKLLVKRVAKLEAVAQAGNGHDRAPLPPVAAPPEDVAPVIAAADLNSEEMLASTFSF